MSKQFEAEEQALEDQLEQGEISQKKFNSEMLDMQRSYRAEAEESAQGAYDQEMERW